MEIYKLIAIDLDGTVLGMDGQMLPSTITALEKAHNAGCLITVNTGRARSMIPPQVAQLPFLRYLASDSGAVITDLQSGEVLRIQHIEKPLALEIAALAKAGGAAVNVSFGHRHYFEWKAMWMYRRTLRESGEKGPTLVRFLTMLAEMSVVADVRKKIEAATEPVMKLEGVYPARAVATAQMEAFLRIEGIQPVQALGGSIEITAKLATKGEALAFICEREGIDPQQVMAFGDSGNDLSMQQFAGCFVAMGNADDEVKAVADHVTESVANDGVGKALHRLLGLV